MKAERGFVHLLIAGEIVLLVIIIIFGVVKQAKGTDGAEDYVASTQINQIEEMPTETELATETETEVPAMVFAEEVETMLSNMSIEQQVAQLFIVSPETLTGTDHATVAGDGTKSAFATYQVGGVVYTRSNYTGRSQMKKLITGMQDISFEQYGQYPFVVTPVEVDEVPMLAVAWKDAEDEMTELVRVEGNIRQASLSGLSLMSYIETEEALIAALGSDALRCVAIETNQLDAVTMLQSGADLLYVTEGFADVYNAVLEAVQANAITETQIHDAAGRVLTYKTTLSAQE